MRNQFVRLAVILMLISGLSSGALALVDAFTSPRIRAAKEAALQQSLAEALPGAAKFTEDMELLDEIKKADPSFAIVRDLYRADTAGGGRAGLVVAAAPRGYSSEIEIMIGIGQDGELEAVRVLAQNETPGLGGKVTEAEFLEQFRGARSGESLKLNRDGGRVAAVTGATISSRAVTRAVDVALALAKRAGL